MTLQAIKMPATHGEFRNMAINAPEQKPEIAPEQRNAAQAWFTPIFREICVHCPGWKNAIPEESIGITARVWFEALTSKRELLNHDVLKRGMRNLQAKRLTWLPSPLDFVDMCLEDENSLPSLADAMAEVREKAHSAKFRVNGDPEVSYSHPMIKHLAGQCGGLFLTGIGEKPAKEEFARSYKKAAELSKAGAFDLANIPRLEKKAEDENLAYYKALVRDFAFMPTLADDYLQACREKGIYIDTVNETVTHDANMVDHSKQKAGAA